MATVNANGIDISYEVLGSGDGEPMLLVMGLGAQMIRWPDGFCDLLVEHGFRVIRFDNRDVGLSTKIEGAEHDLAAGYATAMAGGEVDAPYLLSDMADDAFGLLDALGIESAHVVGASMGGMIAQTMAIARPRRVRTLTSIMSTTGDPAVGQPAPDGLQVLLQPPPSGREAYLDHAVRVHRVLSGPGFPFDEADAREQAARSFDRCYYPVGLARQLLAIVASGDRTPALRELVVPTLVIHGDADPLVAYSGGRATAAAVPGSRLVTVPGMGHTLPEGAWPTIVGAIADHAHAAASAA